MFNTLEFLIFVSLACRVQMANLATFLSTSFHTKLSFMDADSEENLEDEVEEDDYNADEDEDEDIKVHSLSSSGILLPFLFLMSGTATGVCVCVLISTSEALATPTLEKMVHFIFPFTFKELLRMCLTSTSPTSCRAQPQSRTSLPSRRGSTMCSAPSTPPGTS